MSCSRRCSMNPPPPPPYFSWDHFLRLSIDDSQLAKRAFSHDAGAGERDGEGEGRPVNKIEQLPLKSFKCYCLCALPQVISTLVLLRHATPPTPSAHTQCFLLTQSERREVLQLRLQLQVPVPVPVTVPIQSQSPPAAVDF